MKKTKKFKENHPEFYHVHDRHVSQRRDLQMPADVGIHHARRVISYMGC